MNDVNWRLPYFLISMAVSFALATLITYCFERPVTRALTRAKPQWVSRGGDSLRAEIAAPVVGLALYVLLRAVLGSIIT